MCVLIRDAIMLRVGMLLSTGTESAFRVLCGSMMITCWLIVQVEKH